MKPGKLFNPLFFLVAALLALAFLPSCNTIIGKAYENTTGRYNSYYLAKEKMKEVDVALKAKIKDDYHRILSIHYPSDSNFGKSQNAALEDVFKYASWSVRFHKTSKWADNCYILIGKVRHYQYNYKDGLETFKYVNSTSRVMEDRHESLIQMMKFFRDFNEQDNAKYVIDFLDTEVGQMTKKNKRDYLVAKAAYYQWVNDYPKVHILLDSVIPMCNRKQDRARLSFINGQVAEYLKEEAGQTKTALSFDADKDAYKSYKTTLKTNPKYELWFNARMNLMRVSPYSDLKDQEKAREYYHKLLADLKNADYKDRIYYDFAGFERKLKNYDKAQEYYKLSVQKATTNQRQKAYSYLALAEMYYDEMQRFEDAKLYYDSTIAILPRDHKGYGKIFRRQRVLKEFVEHLNTVKREDSLQKLAKMDSAELDRFLTDYKTKEEKRLNDEAKRLAKIAKQKAQAGGGGDGPFSNSFTPTGAPDQGQGSKPVGFNPLNQTASFYFYNKETVMQGQIEFQQKWGKRKKLDFWNVKAIEVEDIEGQSVGMVDSAKGGKKDSTSLAQKDRKEQSSEEAKMITIDKAELYNTVPTTPEKLQASNDKLQASLFKLGKMYNQHLNEPENSIKSLERLIHDFPENDNVPEAHYLIYLIQKGRDSSQADLHKETLLSKYPESLYAKLLKNPNYLAETKVLNKQIMQRYKVAYHSYLMGNYKEADSLFTQIQTDYPGSEYEPKIELVRAIMIGRQGKKQEYKSELDAYLDKYKKGQYHDYAMALKGKLDTEMSRKLNENETGFVEDSTKAPAPAISAPPVPSPNDQQQRSIDSPPNQEMPEELKKMYEEKMRNRGEPVENVPTPNSPSNIPNAPVQEPAPVPNPLDTNRKGF